MNNIKDKNIRKNKKLLDFGFERECIKEDLLKFEVKKEKQMRLEDKKCID